MIAVYNWYFLNEVMNVGYVGDMKPERLICQQNLVALFHIKTKNPAVNGANDANHF